MGISSHPLRLLVPIHRDAAGSFCDRGLLHSLTGLSLLPLGSPDEPERNTNEAFEIYRKTPGSRVIAGSHCRGVALPEIRSADADDQTGSTRVIVFGRTRQLTLDASDNSRDRNRMLQAP